MPAVPCAAVAAAVGFGLLALLLAFAPAGAVSAVTAGARAILLPSPHVLLPLVAVPLRVSLLSPAPFPVQEMPFQFNCIC